MVLGMLDEDEATYEPTDRSYWESKRSNKKMVGIADKVLDLVKEINPVLELKYNKHYIGMAASGVANNFAICKPKKGFMRLEIKLKKTDEISEKLEESGLSLMDYSRWGFYRINLKENDLSENYELLKELLHLAYNQRN